MLFEGVQGILFSKTGSYYEVLDRLRTHYVDQDGLKRAEIHFCF